MASQPAQIYLQEGSVCSVCLDAFSAEAVAVVAGSVAEPSGVAEACRKLRQLEPPIVVLRCGHPLHIECAEAAVTASAARHVRCPLCREPVSFSGDASARLFS